MRSVSWRLTAASRKTVATSISHRKISNWFKQFATAFGYQIGLDDQQEAEKRNGSIFESNGSRDFYDFLLHAGLTPAKSKTLGPPATSTTPSAHLRQSEIPQLDQQEVAACFGIHRGWLSKDSRAYATQIFGMVYYQGAWPFLSRKWVVAEKFMRAWRNRKTREN